MLIIGKYQTLKLERRAEAGVYLRDEEHGETVLLPNKYITEEMVIGGTTEVFVYKDSEDRPVATTEKPLITLGEFAYLKVLQVNDTGAFLDWGLVEKNLLVPFRNQVQKMVEGRSYLVYLYEDQTTHRLVGTAKVGPYLSEKAAGYLAEGEVVNLLVWERSDLGVKVIVNQTYIGLIYENEIFQPLHTGDKLKGYIKFLRGDGKIDISLNPPGYASVEPNAQRILQKLADSGGFFPATDKTDPEEIKKHFAMSKKLFKKAIGALYKQRLIDIREDGVWLVGK
ncbi:MAG: S1-like domain-containing RNA-binding protein [Bacteroidia bacterium]|nr:S1-like domain-containing RNA-binding protein [Bacteroidia bacterium]